VGGRPPPPHTPNTLLFIDFEKALFDLSGALPKVMEGG